MFNVDEQEESLTFEHFKEDIKAFELYTSMRVVLNYR